MDCGRQVMAKAFLEVNSKEMIFNAKIDKYVLVI